MTNPETARGTRRVSPITTEITSQIIAEAPASAAPQIAPDIPAAIDPGPVPGVARDDLTDTAVAEAVRLPVEAGDLATRDLVRALHQAPRHVILVFSGHRVSLFDGVGGRLAPAANTPFPMDLPAPDSGAPDGDGLGAALAAVDVALGGYLRGRPVPVVLAGPQRLVSAFWPVSGNMARLAGTVYGGFDDAPTAELARRTRPVLDRYLSARQHAALTLLEERAGGQHLASGFTSVWQAARTRQPEMLLVEQAYRYPARLSADGCTVTPADDVTAPDAIEDLVDELIQTVLDRGGSIALAGNGALPNHARVALTFR